jgi:TolB-like protein
MMMAICRRGVTVRLDGDHAAVEAAAHELKRRLGRRFVVSGRRKSEGGVVVRAVMLVDAAIHLDAEAADLLDLVYSGRTAAPVT